ncbi:hypothetical protein BH09ACT6_BH09ACT6_05850 [soil metagenome]
MTQRDKEWLGTATAAERRDAREAGELNTLLGMPAPYEPSGRQFTREDLEQMTRKERTAALTAGELDELLGRQRTVSPNGTS